MDQELKATRRLLERVPNEHLDWQPHERSMTLRELAGHIATLPFWQARTSEADDFDLAAPPPLRPDFDSRAEILDYFDTKAAQAAHSAPASQAVCHSTGLSGEAAGSPG